MTQSQQQICGLDTLVGVLSNLTEVGLLVISPDHTVQFASKRASELLSCADFNELSKCPSAVEEAIKRAMDKLQSTDGSDCDEPVKKIDARVSDGIEVRDVRLHVYPIDVDTCTGAMIVVQDLTEQELTVQDMLLASRFRHLIRLSHALEHDLRTPLIAASLVGYQLNQHIERTVRGNAPDPVFTELSRLTQELNSCVAEADSSIQLLVNQISNEWQQPRVTNLNEIIHETVRLVETESRRYNLRLLTDLPGAIVHVKVRPDRLKQSILNLTMRAVDVSPNHGRIQLRVSADDDTVTMLIQDDGPRIDHPEKMFDRYHLKYRSNSGIGMYVARTAIRDAGGDLIYCPPTETEDEPTGNLFRVTLPRATVSTRDLPEVVNQP